jgi:hypothetical protein
MEASSPATTVNSASSALHPTMTPSHKWVPIKRQQGDGEISNITNAKTTMLGIVAGIAKLGARVGERVAKKYKAQIVIFCILLAVNRFPRISRKAKSC